VHNKWQENIDQFIELTQKHSVKMILVGGGAVNFHGYQRHSADVDFWIDVNSENLKKLVLVFNEMGYEIVDIPEKVKNQEQKISIKISPTDLNLELITKFDVNKPFKQAYEEAKEVIISGNKLLKWKVISLEDLITSKIKANKPKDLLDIQQLKEINNS
jgi:predicted nucleotidyltransferase